MLPDSLTGKPTNSNFSFTSCGSHTAFVLYGTDCFSLLNITESILKVGTGVGVELILGALLETPQFLCELGGSSEQLRADYPQPLGSHCDVTAVFADHNPASQLAQLPAFQHHARSLKGVNFHTGSR